MARIALTEVATRTWMGFLEKGTAICHALSIKGLHRGVQGPSQVRTWLCQ